MWRVFQFRKITLHHRIREDENPHAKEIKEFDCRISLANESKENLLTDQEIEVYVHVLSRDNMPCYRLFSTFNPLMHMMCCMSFYFVPIQLQEASQKSSRVWAAEAWCHTLHLHCSVLPYTDEKSQCTLHPYWWMCYGHWTPGSHPSSLQPTRKGLWSFIFLFFTMLFSTFLLLYYIVMLNVTSLLLSRPKMAFSPAAPVIWTVLWSQHCST